LDISNRTIVERFANEISVVAGNVTTKRGEFALWWVEISGERVSNFTDINTAIGLATERLWQPRHSCLVSNY
jgi:hypothetical protein